ncbi:hypothetical protein BS50DRAFT_135697 [Corynespora cassiicola Philippines]|uniref:Uncharacterized protein n=1 Tax=Corynespora cassiicola Philippines TaxID=1448308 RepID=A0A2T2N9B6_CORCC|nr:hypothetical protein BS50DRAFT_135697 [Corynespora cassiicola Philippines]
MASWKIFPSQKERQVESIRFTSGRAYFAVDDSGSTSGTVSRREKEFVDQLRQRYPNPQDSISLWGSHCDDPTTMFESVRWNSNHLGTSPSQILRNQKAMAAILESDIWYLVTDGEIPSFDVHRLAEMANESGAIGVPIVFLIVGRCGESPGSANISVGISLYASAQNSLVLFKERSAQKLYVIAGKGCFSPLVGSGEAQELTSWSALPSYGNEKALFRHWDKLNIQIPRAKDRETLPKGISLGEEWEYTCGGNVLVDLDLLLQAGLLSDKDIFDVLAEEAFNTLSVAYKTRKRLPELRAFVQRQKIEQVSPKFGDVAGASSIIVELGKPGITDQKKRSLQEQLRDAHAKNRGVYQSNLAHFAASEEMMNLRKRNLLIDAALRTLASVEAAGFNAEILSRKSNRARRAEIVDTNNISVSNLDLDGPSYKGFCLVCSGDEEIMCICLKQLDDEHVEDNTTDFALNFPLAAGSSAKNANLVSSQNVCFQCALAASGMSIYQEKLKAVIPTVEYVDSNKKYINDQLYLALTSGLSTGAAGIAQLFMAILHEVLDTKPWAGAGLDEEKLSTAEKTEAGQRRETFRWMLDQLIQYTRTRKNFTETGDWVRFPEALAWAADDFAENGLASFAVTYPAAGFDKLVSLGIQTAAFSGDELRQLRSAKVVYSIAAKYLGEMQTNIQNSVTGDDWKHKYLATIYQDFNSTMIPKDAGSDSLVTDTDVFVERLSACLGGLRSRDTDWATGEEAKAIMGKIQLIVFWLVFQQKSHCMPQTFFWNINHRETLAKAVLDPSLSVPDVSRREILLSIFAKQKGRMIDESAAAKHNALVPFANPFGASVMQCGVESCQKAFGRVTGDAVTPRTITSFRQGRRDHLVHAFGIHNRFEGSDTGLPANVVMGQPPTSIHVNLHINVVRAWAEQSQEARRAIVSDDKARDGFIADVRSRICGQGRGDVYKGRLYVDIKAVLPSFWHVLGEALRLRGKSGEDVWAYEHNFDENKMEAKIRWELEAAKERDGEWVRI